MTSTFPGTGQAVPEPNAPGQTPILNQLLYLLDAGFPNTVIISYTTSTPPASPSIGDVYIVPHAGGSGEWSGHNDELTIWLNGWVYLTPKTGWSVRPQSWGLVFEYHFVDVSTGWQERGTFGSAYSGLTASTTQTQGQEPLIYVTNQIATVANPNDVVTLWDAMPGRPQIVVNDGANTLQIYPASGDEIDGGGTDASVTLAAGGRALFVCYYATKWAMIVSA